MNAQKGDLVKVKAYGGQMIVRRVVEVRERSVILTTKEEYETAAREKREPICIGFPLSDVVEENQTPNR
jgi:hypothetical protein